MGYEKYWFPSPGGTRGGVFSDDAKIRVILNNLIGNAYKFQKDEGEPKKIDLKISVNDGATPA